MYRISFMTDDKNFGSNWKQVLDMKGAINPAFQPFADPVSDTAPPAPRISSKTNGITASIMKVLSGSKKPMHIDEIAKKLPSFTHKQIKKNSYNMCDRGLLQRTAPSTYVVKKGK